MWLNGNTPRVRESLFFLSLVETYFSIDFDLEGVEYQAICSGLHRIESDVMYVTVVEN